MPTVKYVVTAKKIELDCPNCPAELLVPAEQAGSTVRCHLCGHPIPVPALPREAAHHIAKPTLQAGEKGKLTVVVGASAFVVLLIGVAAMVVGAEGGPTSLTIFSLSFAAGWLTLGAALAPLLFPARVPEWFTGRSQWLGYHWLFLPLTAAAFFFAWLTYSP